MSHLITADTQAEVYSVPETARHAREIRACLRATRRSYSLGNPSGCGGGGPCGGTRKAILAGPIVAYEQYDESANEAEWLVLVRDLRNGKILRKLPTGTPLRPEPTYVGVGPVMSMVVKRDGAVAWITEDLERSRGRFDTSERRVYHEVEVADRTGTRVLAAGFRIKGSSLTLKGSTLHWRNGGKVATARLH